jgi:hypothetical protein
LLLGAGRKPNVEQLGLEAASVRFRRDGAEVDEYLRTSNPDIYAAGDVAFPHKFTHAAMATARLCVANALDGAGRRARELVIPHCTYTDPEVAQVGLTPRQAQEEGIAIDEYRLELTKVERAFIDGEEEGFAAIYTRRGSGEIVGATLVSAHAGEMISELTLAMTHKVPLEVLAETVYCYPTQAEFFSESRCSTPVAARSRRPNRSQDGSSHSSQPAASGRATGWCAIKKRGFPPAAGSAGRHSRPSGADDHRRRASHAFSRATRREGTVGPSRRGGARPCYGSAGRSRLDRRRGD